MPVDDLLLKPAIELRDLIRNRVISPVELIEKTLSQIEQRNKIINAVVTLDDVAIDDAKRIEAQINAGKEAGILAGLPVGIKDVTPVAGLRNTYGSLPYADNIATEDALLVQRLKAAGAIIIGKTNTPEFTAGANTFNEVFGATRNPWNTALSAGGSTGGGAAALASGMIALAEGTDLGGSLRIPAAFCGVVGLRPTPGLVPVFPSDFAWDNLSVSGPMGRTAEDVAMMLQVIAGISPRAPYARSLAEEHLVATVRKRLEPADVKIAWCADIAGIGIEEDIISCVKNAVTVLSDSGFGVSEKNFDLSYAWEAFQRIRAFWMVASHYQRLDLLDQFGDNLRGNIEAGLQLSTRDLAEAEHLRGKLLYFFNNFFQKYDFLLTPCTAVSPFPVEQNYPDSIGGNPMKTYTDWFAPTFILSLTGLPVACVPCGLDSTGLPVGIQVVGRQLGEAAVLALAGVIQKLLPVGLPEEG